MLDRPLVQRLFDFRAFPRKGLGHDGQVGDAAGLPVAIDARLQVGNVARIVNAEGVELVAQEPAAPGQLELPTEICGGNTSEASGSWLTRMAPSDGWRSVGSGR